MAGPLIDLVRVHPDAEVPAYATAGANGFDLCAWWTGPELFKVVKAKQTLMVGTGWKFGLPNPWALVVLPRSGMTTARGAGGYGSTDKGKA